MFFFIRGINENNYPCLSGDLENPSLIPALERLASAKKDIEHCIKKIDEKKKNYSLILEKNDILELDDENDQDDSQNDEFD